MINDLSDVESGDRLWHIVDGEVIVDEVSKSDLIYLMDYKPTFRKDGKRFSSDRYPMLYRSYEKMLEYFTELNKFDLTSRLRNMTTCKTPAYVLDWNKEENKLDFFKANDIHIFGVVYFQSEYECYSLVQDCIENDITKQEFEEAFKTVFGGV